EAGHAVVARMLGYKVQRVSIGRGNEGHVSWKHPINRRTREALEFGSEEDIDRVRHRIEHEIIVCMAGVLAQKHHNSHSDWRYAGSGAERGDRFLLKGSDDQLALGLLYRLHEDQRVRKAHHQYLKARAQALVERHWLRIKRLAEALLQHGIIRGDDV